MAKREQVGAEELKNLQLAQEAEKEVGSIAQARAAYEQLMMKFVLSAGKGIT